MYTCELCHYTTDRSSNFKKHFETKKHIVNVYYSPNKNICTSLDISNVSQNTNILTQNKIKTFDLIECKRVWSNHRAVILVGGGGALVIGFFLRLRRRARTVDSLLISHQVTPSIKPQPQALVTTPSTALNTSQVEFLVTGSSTASSTSNTIGNNISNNEQLGYIDRLLEGSDEQCSIPNLAKKLKDGLVCDTAAMAAAIARKKNLLGLNK